VSLVAYRMEFVFVVVGLGVLPQKSTNYYCEVWQATVRLNDGKFDKHCLEDSSIVIQKNLSNQNFLSVETRPGEHAELQSLTK